MMETTWNKACLKALSASPRGIGCSMAENGTLAWKNIINASYYCKRAIKTKYHLNSVS
jgi:hypothetical protein